MTGSRVVRLGSEPPLSAKARLSEDGRIEIVIVGSAASLLEDDWLTVDIDLSAGADVVVTSVAAQIAHPCPSGGSTRFDVNVRVGDGSALRWWPEPTIVCAGASHRAQAVVAVAEGGVVIWRDEMVLGRSFDLLCGCSADKACAEEAAHANGTPDAGRAVCAGGPRRCGVTTSVRVDRRVAQKVRPVLRDGIDTTASGWDGPAVVDRNRYFGSVLAVGVTPETDGWAQLADGCSHLLRVLDRDPASGIAHLASAARWTVPTRAR